MKLMQQKRVDDWQWQSERREEETFMEKYSHASVKERFNPASLFRSTCQSSSCAIGPLL